MASSTLQMSLGKPQIHLRSPLFMQMPLYGSLCPTTQKMSHYLSMVSGWASLKQYYIRACQTRGYVTQLRGSSYEYMKVLWSDDNDDDDLTQQLDGYIAPMPTNVIVTASQAIRNESIDKI